MPLDSELELTAETAHLDEAHIGDIKGALGTIRQRRHRPSPHLASRGCARCSRSSAPA